MEKTPILSFITVNYNGLSDTCEFINSIYKHIKSISYEIIVVDNASKNKEAEELHRLFPYIKVIANNKNAGFAGGNNLGICQATGKYLFFINNDTYFEEDHLLELIKRLEDNPKIGGLSPKICFSTFPKLIQYAGFTPLSEITIRNKAIAYCKPDNGSFDTASRTAFLHGAAMLIKQKIIEKVGMMSERFFLYYEEMDWCSKIINAGYELWYDPCCCVFHKESKSINKINTLKLFYNTRNRLLYAWRNRKSWIRYSAIIYLCTIAYTKNALIYLLKGKYSMVFTIYKAIFAFIILPHKTN